MITFQNAGELNPIAISTFGINAKGNENAIGYFGTGLKYAIAVILREGGSIIINSGDNVYEFGVLEEHHRGKQFDLVAMNGEPLGFTTELGKNWELWMAYRELYCNALDEGGAVHSESVPHGEGMTTIRVELDAFNNVHRVRGSIVLDSKPSHEGECSDVHMMQSKYIFYRGVRIHESPKPLLYCHNIKCPIDITEDRTARYGFQMNRAIARTVMQCEDSELIESVLLAGFVYYEGTLEFGEVGEQPSSVFLEVAQKCRLKSGFNLQAIKVLVQHGFEMEIENAPLNKIQDKQLEKAVKFCEVIGYKVTQYPITVTDDIRSGIHGLATKKHIYISTECFGMGTKYVASTLIEEFLHLHTGYSDCTRELQNHLFNDIVSLGEQLLGEPL